MTWLEFDMIQLIKSWYQSTNILNQLGSRFIIFFLQINYLY